MKIDIDYVKQILNVFRNAEKSHITIHDLKEADILKLNQEEPIDEKFIFHFQLLTENQFIGNSSLRHVTFDDMGFSQDMAGTWFVRAEVLRLTSKGHDFTQILNNQEILSKLKTGFKDSTLNLIFKNGYNLIK